MANGWPRTDRSREKGFSRKESRCCRPRAPLPCESFLPQRGSGRTCTVLHVWIPPTVHETFMKCSTISFTITVFGHQNSQDSIEEMRPCGRNTSHTASKTIRATMQTQQPTSEEVASMLEGLFVAPLAIVHEAPIVLAQPWTPKEVRFAIKRLKLKKITGRN